MTLFDYYLQYMTQICEGSLTAPEGITLTENDEMHRAMELQRQIGAMGIPAFVRVCAAAAGDEVPQAAYDSFSMDDAPPGSWPARPGRSRRRSLYRRSRIRTQASTPLRFFWIVSPWMTGWCSTLSRC